jgi:hypothetical protein
MRGLQYGAAIAACCVLVSARASADPLSECVQAYDDAQQLQNRGKYVEAAKRALGCTNSTCPATAVAECTKIREAILTATPTVVLGAHDGDQNDLVNVRVFIDGKIAREQLDGTPFPLDPGIHTFRFEAPSLPPVEKSQTIYTGEKLRMVSVMLGEPHKPKPDPRVLPPGQTVVAPQQPSPLASRTALVSAGVVGGLGVLAIGGFGLLRWSGMNAYDRMAAPGGCSPNCKDSDVSPVRTQLVAADVLLGVGAAAVVTSAGLFLGRLAVGSMAEVRVVPQRSGGGAQIVAHF